MVLPTLGMTAAAGTLAALGGHVDGAWYFGAWPAAVLAGLFSILLAMASDEYSPDGVLYTALASVLATSLLAIAAHDVDPAFYFMAYPAAPHAVWLTSRYPSEWGLARPSKEVSVLRAVTVACGACVTSGLFASLGGFSLYVGVLVGLYGLGWSFAVYASIRNDRLRRGLVDAGWARCPRCKNLRRPPIDLSRCHGCGRAIDPSGRSSCVCSSCLAAHMASD
jgi:hypothetical protein